jgi:hypothetical protein
MKPIYYTPSSRYGVKAHMELDNCSSSLCIAGNRSKLRDKMLLDFVESCPIDVRVFAPQLHNKIPNKENIQQYTTSKLFYVLSQIWADIEIRLQESVECSVHDTEVSYKPCVLVIDEVNTHLVLDKRCVNMLQKIMAYGPKVDYCVVMTTDAHSILDKQDYWLQSYYKVVTSDIHQSTVLNLLQIQTPLENLSNDNDVYVST